ncbi:MAG: hypothetical protein RIC16_03300 [Rhodospirillales bacterium]
MTEWLSSNDQDLALGVTGAVSQGELADLRTAGRLGEYAVVFRTRRGLQGGGYGDQDRHPFAWGVIVYVDGAASRLQSARGHAREWTSLERLEKWMRAQGFWYWWMRNDLEPLYAGDASDSDDPD